MHVESLSLEGFAALPAWEGHLARVARFDGPPRALRALADALLLLAAATDRAALDQLLAGWGVPSPVVHGEDLPEGAQWEGPPRLAALVASDADGLLKVSGTVRLDPPLYGRLRKLATRDPRLVDALGADSTLTLKVGARFSPRFDAVGIDLLAFHVGGIPFPVAGKERPDWLSPLLHALAGRVFRGAVPESTWAERARCWEGGAQRNLRRALDALARPPLRRGEVLVLPEGLGVLEGDRVVPLAWYGPDLTDGAGLVGAVFLSGAEVLVLDRPPAGAAWARWLAAQAEAQGSPLEQIVLLGVPGGASLG